MSRPDRRRWRAPQSVTELGHPMALWLEGEIRSWPGYAPNWGPDEETTHLVPMLAALCRSGFVTTFSQPGLATTGVDGRWWQQRAAVEGYIADQALYDQLLAAADAAGFIVVATNPGTLRQQASVTVTTRDGEPVTRAGHYLDHPNLRVEWPHISPAAYRDVARAASVAIIAPEYGPIGERLWPALETVCRTTRAEGPHAAALSHPAGRF
ncbi:DUF6919 domain-containing protein [Streptomyces niveus]|uniref:DUF6919 domain-containing protein n=1 Tax=Streptomyces niveus TaxID=193462 RepID=UPI003790FB6B